MKIKVKKSYTYKEVCKIRDKAMELGTSKGLKAYQKYLSDYNKLDQDVIDTRQTKDFIRESKQEKK